jgi:esterase/lipase superfamily enzyme
VTGNVCTRSVLRVAFPALLCFSAVIVFGCRPPVLPITRDDHSVIQYDSEHEERLRSGKPLRFGLEGMERYVDKLAEPVAITEWSADHCKWNFFVATNRGKFEFPNDPKASNRVLAQAQYGRCEVILPRNDVGLRMIEHANRKETLTVKSPQHASSASDTSPLQHRTPVSTKSSAWPLSQSAFLEGVAAQVQQSKEQDILVFVHGFNVGFDDAITRTAELALRIPFNGALVSYCWPSQGGVMNYAVDEPINQASVAPFTEFLTSLCQGCPTARIHIVVHSMGNRIVMQSLSGMHQAGITKKFGHVVLCAPDVGVGDFLKWVPGVVEVSERVTTYVNASDSALIVSKGLHAERRVGDAFPPLVVPGIATIDCSRVESSLLGHSYYGDNDDVTNDLFLLLKENLPPDKRYHLTRRNENGDYWEFTKRAPNVMVTWHFKNLK